jgi:hypothetical protein
MPEELETLDEELNETGEQEEAEFLPGELCAIDATNDRVEIEDDESEDGLTADEKENCLQGLANKTSQRDLTSRRLEVRDAWKARYFYRGNQYLLPTRNGAWVLPHMVLMGGQSYDDHNDETNVYLAFADTINAALSAGVPSVRFEADNPTDPADVSAAENSEGARRLIERANDMIVIQEDINRFLWTDGRACVYTRYVIDGQRFGYAEEGESDLDEELSYLPALERDQDEEQLGPGKGKPRGQEVIEAFGALETKLPMQANDIHASDYLSLSREFDITKMKSKYPKKADMIQAMKSPTAESEYERLARTSVMMGTRPSNMTNDAMSYNVTEALVWVRPSFFREEHDNRLRKWLYENFPKGAMIAQCGTTFCEARNESLDDHWTLIHARPGDGMHRPGNGTPLIPLQEKLNDCMDLVHQSFMHLIPITWIDSEGLDAQALNEMQRNPGQYRKMKRKPDKELSANFYTEQQVQIAEGLLVYLEKLFGEFAQFLVGAFPALFGGNTGSNDTASGISSQRDQALGRVGLTWRNIRAGYARIIRQAVQCAAEFRNSPLAGDVPGAGGVKDHLSIHPDDLKGNVRCFPDSEEAFPESWVAQRAVWTQAAQQAEKNPVFAAIFSKVRNLMIAKDKIGLPELVVPGADAAVKQAGEIMQLLSDGAPVPNPAIEQLKQSAPPIPPEAPPEATQMRDQLLQQAIAKLPPVVSTVQVFRLDQDAAEIDYIETWASLPDGIRARAENPDGFANVMAHYDEHQAQLAKKQADKAQPPESKPPSESISYKDLTPEGKVQLAAKGGIKLDLAKLQAEDAQDKVAEAAKAAAGKNGSGEHELVGSSA